MAASWNDVIAGGQLPGQRVGVIGLGHMGVPMAGRLLDAAVPLAVYNRTPEKAQPLLQRGARWVESPAEAARQSDLVISIVLDDAALRDVALGDHGVLAGGRPGLLLVEMSTVSPQTSALVAEACEHAGIGYVRAPFSGSTVLAADGKLTILASGQRDSYERALPILRIFGSQQFYLGPKEEARVLKLALNMVIAVTMAGLSEALVMTEAAGLDWEQTLDVFCGSVVGSPLLNYKAPQLARRDFAAAATVDLFRKDLHLALETARQLDVAAPVTALTRQLFQATAGAGWGDQDFASILLLVEQMAGMSRKPT